MAGYAVVVVLDSFSGQGETNMLLHNRPNRGGGSNLPMTVEEVEAEAEAEAKSEIDVRLWGRKLMMTAVYMQDYEGGVRRDMGGHDRSHWAVNR